MPTAPHPTFRRSGRGNAHGTRCPIGPRVGVEMTRRKGKLGSGLSGRAGGHRSGEDAGRPRPGGGRPAPRGGPPSLWLYGVHAVLAALDNPQRRPERLLATPEAAQAWRSRLHAARPGLAVETVQRREIDALLPDGSV